MTDYCAPANLQLAALGLLGIIVGWHDHRRGIIPNWATYGAAAAGVLLHVLFLPQVLAPMLLAASVVFAVALASFALGFMGGGDAKLLTAVTALVGYPACIDALVYALVIGCVMALIRLIWSRQFFDRIREVFHRVVYVLMPGSDKKMLVRPFGTATMPFGVPVVAGAIVSLLYEPLLVNG